jgi:carbamoyltransferase
MEHKIDICGIHDGHNSTVAILREGKLIDVLQEERIVRIKNAGDFPENSLRELMAVHHIDAGKLSLAFNGHYMNYGVWDRQSTLEDYEKAKSFNAVVKNVAKRNQTIFSLYKSRKRKKRLSVMDGIFGTNSTQIYHVEHHMAHAAAAYYGWGIKDKVLVLTCDGFGDGLCATVNIGEKGKLRRIAAIAQDDSVGRLYAFITFLMGMMPLEHEYKIMGLAPYSSTSSEARRICSKFSDLFTFKDETGGMTWKRKEGVPPIYAPRDFIDRVIYRERFDWIAAGLQLFIEEFLRKWVKNCIRETGIRKIALSGGVFMNVKANKIIYEIPEVEEMFIFPSCGDESNAIGAAYQTYIDQGGNDLKPLKAIYFGRAITDEDVDGALRSYKMTSSCRVDYLEDVEKKIAELMAEGDIVGRVKGKMEFGARALGNRSILANPSKTHVVRIINEIIKSRDFWMPFAPSVLAESSEKYFIKPKPMSSPYMMMTFDTIPDKREKIMAALHPYDFTARPQEVIKEWNPDYHRLISYYQEITGESLILNTSYNLHGHPIVYTPLDALDVFNNSGLKYLAIGNFLITKKSC